ncbi:hypothetical protein PTTG_03071 [Puccinia triticina 1-1 BBBD Race 1]|uniref:Uncharacterized protein n=1 Tax=Puccinia triticina (isolate 1-1 / race 1 (BBBD)) TaxID=630390 RepID=A0A180GPY5_PUCT1|nr:hypothetical protein PTTG_03071 [Puccinia triticina 1-1 BBBD Race 1]
MASAPKKQKISTASASAKPAKNKKKKQKKIIITNTNSCDKSDSDNPSDNESKSKKDPAIDTMNLAQNSDSENAKVTQKKNTQGPSVSKFDNVGLYFFPPVCGKGEHRDGAVGRAACVARAEAIQAGAKLPMTLKDIKAEKIKKQSGFMGKYLGKSSYDNQTLNHILVMWLIPTSLPWI